MAINFIRTALFICVISLCLTLASRPACAAVTEKDFQVILRSLGFVQNNQAIASDFVIVYDATRNDSVQEARQLEDLIKSHKTTTFSLSSRLVSVSDLSQIRGAQAIFLTTGTQAYYGKVAAIARNNGALSISLDRTCVEQQNCILYINTQNRVEILVNEAAAKKSKVEFKPVFLMMVTIL